MRALPGEASRPALSHSTADDVLTTAEAILISRHYARHTPSEKHDRAHGCSVFGQRHLAANKLKVSRTCESELHFQNHGERDAEAHGERPPACAGRMLKTSDSRVRTSVHCRRWRSCCTRLRGAVRVLQVVHEHFHAVVLDGSHCTCGAGLDNLPDHKRLRRDPATLCPFARE